MTFFSTWHSFLYVIEYCMILMKFIIDSYDTINNLSIRNFHILPYYILLLHKNLICLLTIHSG